MTTMTTNDTMTADEAQRLLDGATPGPWTREGVYVCTTPSEPALLRSLDDDGTSCGESFARPNAALAAASPRLAASVVALHAQLAQVTAERDALRTRAEIAETELAGAHKAGGVGRGWWTAQTWWRSRPTPGRSEATEVAALRAIVEGRTTAPSDEEIAAHEAVGRGWWLCVLRGYPDVTTTSVAREWAQHHRAHPEDGGRWWPLDAQKRPCAWPVVDR